MGRYCITELLWGKQKGWKYLKGALEKLRKILLWKPGRVLLAVGCCGLLLLTLIPLLRLAIYAVP